MDASQLPEVTDEFRMLGQYKGIPVTVALGDNQASFLGSVGFQYYPISYLKKMESKPGHLQEENTFWWEPVCNRKIAWK